MIGLQRYLDAAAESSQISRGLRYCAQIDDVGIGFRNLFHARSTL